MKPSYRGKSICKQLKAVRQRIAEENNIPLEQRECTYDGPCRGTCPYCEAEVRYLEKSLVQRLHLGKAATVAGLSLSLAACGGQTNGESGPLVNADSLLPATDTLSVADTDNTVPSEETVCPEVTTEGLCIIDDAIPPPPPPPEGYDDPILVGEEEDYEEEVGETRAFTLVEEDPSFPGGIDSLYAWIQNNIQYPVYARENNITGKVYVTFAVERDGSISNPKVLRDIGGGCGAEAIRIVKAMPRWNPGKQRGKPVRVQFNLPINFTLK